MNSVMGKPVVSSVFLLLLLLGVILIWADLASSQTALSPSASPPAPSVSAAPVVAPAPAPILAPPPPPYSFGQNCSNGVALQYTVESVTISYPVIGTASAFEQPYTFKSSAQLVNTGGEELKNWELFIGFQYDEILVTVGNAILADGSQLPATVGNGTSLMSTTQPNLKTAIETAMDFNQIGATVSFTGTEFGVGPPDIPMPTNISLLNDGYICGKPISSGSTMSACCVKNDSVIEDINDAMFPPNEKGDITILYDITQVYTNNYWAQVTISMDNPLGRLDYWNLVWDWKYNEFIFAMKGAQTTFQELSTCLSGPVGVQYKDVDLTQVMSCQSSPVIIDLDEYKSNDSIVGRIPYCCRNGTLLPTSMNATKSKSAFLLQVYKLPPHASDRMDIEPPINWRINGTFDAGYTCGQPKRVNPTLFPDPASAQRMESAIMSWQVSCNLTVTEEAPPPKCCVSFSAFYNDSVVPCPTCACGCPASQSQCGRTTEALLIPPEVLTVPFVNRTEKTLAWASLKNLPSPTPLPCPDNCGVSINWHVVSDYTNGWSARMTVFNWGSMVFSDWFAAVQLNKTFSGFQQAYSFNSSSTIPGLNDTIFVQGLPGQNYLIGAWQGAPALQQSVLSFTKEGINISALVGRDFFPSKVFFGGEECALPNIIPTASAWRLAPSIYTTFLLCSLILSALGPLGFL